MNDPKVPSKNPSSAPAPSAPEANAINPIQAEYKILQYRLSQTKTDAERQDLYKNFALTLGPFLATEQGRNAALEFAQSLNESEKTLLANQLNAAAEQVKKQQDLEYQLGLLAGQAHKKAVDKTTDMQASADSAMAGMISMAPMIIAACDVIDKTGCLSENVLQWFETRGVEVAQRLSAVAGNLKASASTAGEIRSDVIDAAGNKVMVIGNHAGTQHDAANVAQTRGTGAGAEIILRSQETARTIISAATFIDSQNQPAVNAQVPGFNTTALVKEALNGMFKEGHISEQQLTDFSRKLDKAAKIEGNPDELAPGNETNKFINTLGPDLQKKLEDRLPGLKQPLPELNLQP